MKTCAIACVRNTHALLAASIKHLVQNGIRDFYLFDHGSDPDLASFLAGELASGSARFRILRKETAPFFQQEMVGVMTELAREDGFEVGVAFDADEFWCSTIEGHSLVDQISQELSSDIDALRVPVINYVQHRDVEVFQENALLQCRYSVLPFVDPTRHPRDQVESGLPFVAIPFPSKVIARLSRDIRFTKGQHDVSKAGGQARVIDAAGIAVRHLPLPSRSHVQAKRAHGLRTIADGYDGDIGWQAQRLAHRTDEELDAYWCSNSWHAADDHQARVGTYDRLVQDDALARIAQDISRESAHQELAPGSGTQVPPHACQVPQHALERLIQHLVDETGNNGRTIEALLRARNQAIEERARLRAELSLLQASPRPFLQDLGLRLRPIEKRLRQFRNRLLGSRKKA